MANNELQAMLNRRLQVESGEAPAPNAGSSGRFNPGQEFPEFSFKEVRQYEAMFRQYDTTRDGFISFEELKRMMEALGHPQTHIALRQMIQLIDEDNDGQINKREFFLIFRKARAGELGDCEGLAAIADSVDVAEAGVGGAAAFFEAKAAQQSQGARFEAEIKAEQAEKKAEREAAAQRRAEFKARQAAFAGGGSS